jgi:hypothetical protein
VSIYKLSEGQRICLETRKEECKPAVRIIVKAMDRAITATEADIVKACNCQATVCADIHKEFLLPSLLQHHHIYEIVEKTSQTTLKLSFFLFAKPKLT